MLGEKRSEKGDKVVVGTTAQHRDLWFPVETLEDLRHRTSHPFSLGKTPTERSRRWVGSARFFGFCGESLA